MKNSEWLKKKGTPLTISFQRKSSLIENNLCWRDNAVLTAFDVTVNGENAGLVVSDGAEDLLSTWLKQEHIEIKRQILTDKERKYLEAVCRPFRDRVKGISKMVIDHMYDPPDYYIVIRFVNEQFDMYFPSFDVSAMYKCMEENKWYTPMELGL